MSTANEVLIDDICSAEADRVAAALQAVSPHRESLRHVLLARLLQAAAEPERWIGGKGRPSPIFLCYLAAEWQLTEAHPLIVALLRLPAEQCDDMLGDFITDGARRALADTWPGGTLAGIRALVFAHDAEPFARGAGLNAAALLSVRGRLPRADVHQLLTEGAALPLDPNVESDLFFATAIVSTILDLKARELEPIVGSLFDRDLVDPSICGDRDEVLSELAKPGEPSATDDYHFPPPITSAWETVRRWYFFNAPPFDDDEEEALQDLPAIDAEVSSYREPVTIRRSTPKIGRNDPCPCGSGKKYKKCCGA